MSPYVPILVLVALAAVFAVFSLVAGTFRPQALQPGQAGSLRVRHRADQAAAGGRFPVKYFLTAMLFIVFDIESVFLSPSRWPSTGSGCSRWSRWSLIVTVLSRTPTSGAAAAWSGISNGN